ncbi:MAG: class I SAM-dependent methyltransferase [bacterium]|nr:class I SAM-dependent methyltransferase [bacterium]
MPESHTCPLCTNHALPIFRKGEFSILECGRCEHRFADFAAPSSHVSSVYDDDYFTGGGVGYPDYLSERRSLTRRGKRYARLMKSLGPPGSVLDVGAAAGFILDGFRANGWTAKGIEPNRRMAQFAVSELGLDVQAASLESFETNERYDLVCAIQVLGHFVDPHTAAGHLSRLTRAKGYCLIESWDRKSLSARMFGSGWHEYSPPSVLHYYHHDGLVKLMADHDLTLVRWGRMPKWIEAGHAKSLLRLKLGELPGGSSLARLADVIPEGLSLPYPGDDLKWWAFRKIES